MHHAADALQFAAPARRSLEWPEILYVQMDAIGLLKSWIGALTDIGLMLLALAIVASLLVGGTLPFFGGVVGNIVSMVKDLGSNGLVGLIAVGIIMWLFSKRSLG